jgi:diguanylate cyclase (GGDEF)-like protein
MKWTLNKQLLAPLIAIFVVLTAVGTAVAIKMFTGQANDSVKTQLESTSGAVNLLIQQREADLREKASVGANTPEVETVLTNPRAVPPDLYGALATTDLDAVEFISPTGAFLSGTGPTPSLEGLDLNTATKAQALSTINTSAGAIWLVALAPYRRGTDNVVGFMVMAKRLDQKFLDAIVGAINVEVSLTVDGVSTGSSTAAQYYSPDASTPGSVGQPTQVKINGNSYGVLTTQLEGGAQASGYLSVLMPTGDLMAGVRTRIGQLVGLAWVGGLVVIGVVVWTTRRISGPIHRLAAHAHEISEGSYGQTIEEEGVDEMRNLVQSFNHMSLALHESYEELSDIASTDALTGLHNHRRTQEALSLEIDQSKHTRKPLAVMLIDIDGFKLFNTTYGHAAGDRILKLVAELITGVSRDGDVVGRYGGDKFVLLAPNTSRKGAKLLAERIRARLSEQGVLLENGQKLPLRLSIGVAVCPNDSRNKEELLAYVDASLFESKREGGDKVTLANRKPGELFSYQNTTLGVLDGLVRTVDKKDRYTKAHSEENAEYAMMLGKALGFSEETQSALRIGGLLHDIGKIGIPDHILKKPGPLTHEEREIVQRHVVLSDLIIKGVPHANDVSDAVINHHERWDGRGYPRGLKAEEIPLLGRIMALVDAYSAMTSDRPFRKAEPHSTAVVELRRCAGIQFDPALVEVFIKTLEESGRAAAA